MAVYDALHRGKTDSGSIEFFGLVQPLEGAEQFSGVFHVEPCAIIAHIQYFFTPLLENCREQINCPVL